MLYLLDCEHDVTGSEAEVSLSSLNLAPSSWNWFLFRGGLTISQLHVTGVSPNGLVFGSSGLVAAVFRVWPD